MATIELNTPVLRGQPLEGRLHISTVSPYTAKKVAVTLRAKERYYCRSLSNICDSTCVDKVLFSRNNMEITPPETCVNFSYTISRNAPFTFDTGVNKVFWQIKAVVKKSTFFSEKQLQQFTVLPHILKSQSPVDNVPIPSYPFSIVVPVKKPVHIWRYTHFFSPDTHVNIDIDYPQYIPGDTVSGTVYFLKDFKNCDLTVYLVCLGKPKKSPATAEKEYIAWETHDSFYTGSAISFSCTIPLENYPSFETEHTRIWWVVRAVLKKSFLSTTVVEKEIQVNPLVF